MALLYLYSVLLILSSVVLALPTQFSSSRNVSEALFEELEELARVVDVSYCVGSSGILKPFKCLSRCNDFPGFQLVTTWNTGPLLSDSCGYIAVSNPPHPKRVIVAFRGTYSIANTIADLSTNPAEYAPFPSDHNNDSLCASQQQGSGMTALPRILVQEKRSEEKLKCDNCTVHSGFTTSWRNTRCIIIPHVEEAMRNNPGYKLTLVGHSLGGAVAAMAALEFQARGWTPHVTTFGEPRIGNRELNEYIDRIFNLDAMGSGEALFRRVTHVHDPVPLLPPEEWGYKMHAGEIFISKSSLRPTRHDLEYCKGDEDPACIEGSSPAKVEAEVSDVKNSLEQPIHSETWGVSPRYRLWELFFAHRDYFWRLGLCVPGGDPWDWNREKYNNGMSDEL